MEHRSGCLSGLEKGEVNGTKLKQIEIIKQNSKNAKSKKEATFSVSKIHFSSPTVSFGSGYANTKMQRESWKIVTAVGKY